MQLVAVLGAQTLYLGDDYDFETAYEYILEQDSDPDNPWLEDFALILIDDEDNQWRLECDCWCPVVEELEG